MDHQPEVNLSGEWNFILDPKDEGLENNWFGDGIDYPEKVLVPGSWQAQGIGDHKHLTAPCQSGGLPPMEMEKASYLGTGWYKRKFNVPADWKNKTIWLNFGGTHPVAEFWIDGDYVANHASSILEHRHDVTAFVSPGKEHVLTVRISEYPGNDGKRFWEDPVQGGTMNILTWSGIYREVFLETTEEIWIENVLIVPKIKTFEAQFKLKLNSLEKEINSGELTIKTEIFESGSKNKCSEHIEKIKSSDDFTEFSVNIENAKFWSPESPSLYNAIITLEKNGKVIDTVTERFGMREFSVEGNKILVNGQPVWLRGYGDDQVYAITLSPYTDRNLLLKELKQAKEYGFNYVDFLYGLPHREYLDLADELGILIQCYPTWASSFLSKNEKKTDYKDPEFVRKVIYQIHNHPSVMLYSVAAEVYHFHKTVIDEIAMLEEMVRKLDPTRLIMTTGGIDRNCAGRDDTDIFEMAGSYTTNPCEVNTVTKPVILHEYRWWSSFPDPALRKKYENSGIRPFFIDLTEKVAEEKGLTHLLPKFVENSQKLQAIERKIGAEKARRARGANGYAIWLGKDLKDAVEGIWDDFGDPKNVSASEFMESNGQTVLLIDKDYYYRNYWSEEKIALEVWLSHYGRDPVANATLRWQLKTTTGKCITEGKCENLNFPSFETDRLQYIDIILPKLEKPVETILEITLNSNTVNVINHWNFWVFPRKFVLEPNLKTAMLAHRFSHYNWDNKGTVNDCELAITDKLDESIIAHLEKGGRVLLSGQGIFKEYFSEFKSNIYNTSPNGNSGTIINDHPAMGDFPHEGFCDLQFYGLLEDATTIDLDAWPVKIEPIIRCIDSFKSGRHKAYLFEVKVGKGRLLISSMNFRPFRGIGRFHCEVENSYLFDCLLRYALSDKFNPEAEVPLEFLKKVIGITQQEDQSTAREARTVFDDNY